MIQLILFVSSNAEPEERTLERMILDGFALYPTTICRTLEQIEQLLKQPVLAFPDRRIYILIADSQQRLRDIVQLMEPFDDLENILVLPDEEQATFSIGTRIRPRFVISKGQRFEDVLAVLQKMIDKSPPRTRPNPFAHSSSDWKGLSA